MIRFLHSRLGIGVALFLACALIDIYMTLGGLGGVLVAEGNPFMRATMRWLGIEWALWIQKAAIGAVLIVIAFYGDRAIRNQERWIRKVPSTRIAREWMRKKDRSWIAHIPLYAVAIGQGLAGASWVLVSWLS